MKPNALEQRFVDLVNAHRGLLHQVAHAYGRHAEDRADLLQDMVLQLWRAYPRFDPARASVSTWMYRVAMNVAIDTHRRHTRRDAEHLPLDEFGLDVAAAEAFYDRSNDDMRTLDALIAALDPLNRALLLMFLDGRDAQEICAVLGLSTTNVTTRLSRLKQRLQAQFNPPAPGNTPR